MAKLRCLTSNIEEVFAKVEGFIQAKSTIDLLAKKQELPQLEERYLALRYLAKIDEDFLYENFKVALSKPMTKAFTDWD